MIYIGDYKNKTERTSTSRKDCDEGDGSHSAMILDTVVNDKPYLLPCLRKPAMGQNTKQQHKHHRFVLRTLI